LFRFSPSRCWSTSNLSFSSRYWNTDCQQPFIIVSMLKHHYSTFFISSHPRHFLTILIAETTPSSTCFDILLCCWNTRLSPSSVSQLYTLKCSNSRPST
jgi:hypothetical protein